MLIYRNLQPLRAATEAKESQKSAHFWPKCRNTGIRKPHCLIFAKYRG